MEKKPPNEPPEESVLLRMLKESVDTTTSAKNGKGTKTNTNADASLLGTKKMSDKNPLPPHMEVSIYELIDKLKEYSNDTVRPIKPIPAHHARTALYFITESLKSRYEIEQKCGQALGYPRYADDPQNFPNIDPHDPSVCIGDHVAESIVAELCDKYAKTKR